MARALGALGYLAEVAGARGVVVVGFDAARLGTVAEVDARISALLDLRVQLEHPMDPMDPITKIGQGDQ